MPLYSFGEWVPQVHPEAWVAENATIVGNVIVEAGANIWYGSVLRNEFRDPIIIGAGSSVQDNSVLHTDPGLTLSVGRNVLIGHAACVHGATLEDGCLIGQHATVLNGAVVGAQSTIAAGAVVREGQQIPPGVLAAGVPAQVVRELDDAARDRPATAAAYYVRNGQAHARKRVLVKP
ncbi:MAG TPA: gamma carbonic anhydrase family protein [Acidimicrobiales bacterium]|nr:gamma carbonic anhydrase family protein [Acidimicrobiales bacterium]